MMLVLICGITYCVTNYIQSKQIATTTQAITRTIEVKKNEIDYQSIFDEFEDVKIDINENITSFEGTKTFYLADFEELDLVSDSDVDTRFKVKYSYAFDREQNIVILSAILLNEGGTEIVDTMIGVPFVDENGNFDAVFDCDGEFLLLSELREAGMIENCGWL
ncbi:MAG: hypothetical protein PHX62_09715, partial [Bacilli bacterium]|nr:hypothetical protein [Bacilli bacterium]